MKPTLILQISICIYIYIHIQYVRGYTCWTLPFKQLAVETSIALLILVLLELARLVAVASKWGKSGQRCFHQFPTIRLKWYIYIIWCLCHYVLKGHRHQRQWFYTVPALWFKLMFCPHEVRVKSQMSMSWHVSIGTTNGHGASLKTSLCPAVHWCKCMHVY